MNIKAEIENVRRLMNTLQNWDTIVQEKYLDAIWGHSGKRNNTKVQIAKKNDWMENAILELQEMEEHRLAIFNQYWEEKEALHKIIEKYAKVEDLTILLMYSIGCELSEIPLKGRQKNPVNIVNGAIKRLQAAIDREEEISNQSEIVQRLIRGAKKKCKHCEVGYIVFLGEDAEKFIFTCNGCGRRVKAEKNRAERNDKNGHI